MNEKQADRIIELLEALLRNSLQQVLTEEISEKPQAMVYEMTGTHTREEVAKASGLSTGSVSNLWTRWEQKGLVVKSGKGYRRIV